MEDLEAKKGVCTIVGLSGKWRTAGKVSAEVARLFTPLDIGPCLSCHFQLYLPLEYSQWLFRKFSVLY